VSTVPTELLYTAEHEWVTQGSPVTIGITDHAADALGDVVFLELPEVGAELIAGTVCGEIESTKSVSELYAPVSGTVLEVNAAAVAEPALVNADPYGSGWLLRVEVTASGPVLSAAQYAALVDG